MENISVEARGKISPEEIEAKVFGEIIEVNPLYKPHAKELVGLIQQIKGKLAGSKTDYLNMKNLVKEWYLDHYGKAVPLPAVSPSPAVPLSSIPSVPDPPSSPEITPITLPSPTQAKPLEPLLQPEKTKATKKSSVGKTSARPKKHTLSDFE